MLMKKVIISFQATRPPFLIIIILPVLLGAAIAWQQHQFSLILLVLSLISAICCAGGINVLNDYFDHLSGCDDNHPNPLTPFAGGGRTIQQGLLSANEMKQLGFGLLLSSIILGLALVAVCGSGLLWIGLVGIISSYYYSAPPLALNYRGLGEPLIALNYGILAVLGSYYVQTSSFAVTPVLASIPVSFLATAIITVNEYPDIEADKLAGKKTLLLLFGTDKVSWLFALMLTSSLLFILLTVLAGLLPSGALLCLLLAPLAITATRGVFAFKGDPVTMLPSIKATIALHSLTCCILILVYIVQTPLLVITT